MQDETGGDDALRASLREVGRADGISAVRRLSGGVIADAWLITWADGTSAVGKIVNGAAPDLFRTEAEGLAALRRTGHLATPDVLAVTDRLLLLEALASRDDSAGSWEAFARDMASAHRAMVSDRFGWAADGWLGRLRQVNSSLSIRNSTPRRPDGRTGCPCYTCASCSAASRTSAPQLPMTWGGYATSSARSTSTNPRRRC